MLFSAILYVYNVKIIPKNSQSFICMYRTGHKILVTTFLKQWWKGTPSPLFPYEVQLG